MNLTNSVHYKPAAPRKEDLASTGEASGISDIASSSSKLSSLIQEVELGKLTTSAIPSLISAVGDLVTTLNRNSDTVNNFAGDTQQSDNRSSRTNNSSNSSSSSSNWDESAADFIVRPDGSTEKSSKETESPASAAAAASERQESISRKRLTSTLSVLLKKTIGSIDKMKSEDNSVTSSVSRAREGVSSIESRFDSGSEEYRKFREDNTLTASALDLFGLSDSADTFFSMKNLITGAKTEDESDSSSKNDSQSSKNDSQSSKSDSSSKNDSQSSKSDSSSSESDDLSVSSANSEIHSDTVSVNADNVTSRSDSAASVSSDDVSKTETDLELSRKETAEKSLSKLSDMSSSLKDVNTSVRDVESAIDKTSSQNRSIVDSVKYLALDERQSRSEEKHSLSLLSESAKNSEALPGLVTSQTRMIELLEEMSKATSAATETQGGSLLDKATDWLTGGGGGDAGAGQDTGQGTGRRGRRGRRGRDGAQPSARRGFLGRMTQSARGLFGKAAGVSGLAGMALGGIGSMLPGMATTVQSSTDTSGTSSMDLLTDVATSVATGGSAPGDIPTTRGGSASDPSTSGDIASRKGLTQGTKPGMMGKLGKVGKIGGKLLSKGLKFIPGVGLAMGAMSAYENFKDGNLLSGLGNLASGAVSLIPGVGGVASTLMDLAIDGASSTSSSDSSTASTVTQGSPDLSKMIAETSTSNSSSTDVSSILGVTAAGNVASQISSLLSNTAAGATAQTSNSSGGDSSSIMNMLSSVIPGAGIATAVMNSVTGGGVGSALGSLTQTLSPALSNIGSILTSAVPAAGIYNLLTSSGDNVSSSADSTNVSQNLVAEATRAAPLSDPVQLSPATMAKHAADQSKIPAERSAVSSAQNSNELVRSLANVVASQPGKSSSNIPIAKQAGVDDLGLNLINSMLLQQGG